MRTMNIGRLNKRVTFYKKTDSLNTLNQQSKKLEELGTVWGSCYPTRGGEYYEAQKLREELTWKVYVRFPKSFEVRADMFIGCGGKTFSIKSVIDVDYEGKMLEIDCIEYITKSR